MGIIIHYQWVRRDTVWKHWQYTLLWIYSSCNYIFVFSKKRKNKSPSTALTWWCFIFGYFAPFNNVLGPLNSVVKCFPCQKCVCNSFPKRHSLAWKRISLPCICAETIFFFLHFLVEPMTVGRSAGSWRMSWSWRFKTGDFFFYLFLEQRLGWKIPSTFSSNRLSEKTRKWNTWRLKFKNEDTSSEFKTGYFC